MEEKEKISELIESIRQESAITPGKDYAVPDDYFADLPSKLMLRTQVSEVDSRRLPTPYQAPQAYFEEMDSRMLHKIRRPVPAIGKKLAIAASVLVLIALGTIQLWRKAPVEKNTIPGWGVSMLEEMDSGDLANFIEEDPELNPRNQSTVKTSNDNQLFRDISTAELERFLNENISDEKETFFN